jgi:OCT family organic cation transporter-like MFS transporter 4/5
VTGHFTPENCFKYEFTHASNDSFPLANGTCSPHWFGHDRVQCGSWMFEEGEKTIVNEWPDELTCAENQWKLALVGSIHFAGIMIGSGVFGFLADYYGRKRIFIIAIMFMSLTGVGQAVSTSYLMFTIFALLNAIGTSGVYPLAFVLGVEMVGKNKREMSGVVLNYFYSVGQALVGLIAWLDGNWRSLQYWVSVPPFVFIIYHWIIPESARWLLAKKRNRKALKIISKAAKNNGVELSQGILDSFNEENEKIADAGDGDNEDGHRVRLSDYMAVARSKVIAVRCLMLFFIW